MLNGIDRAWSRRPFVSPPRWAPTRALSDLWTETVVTFSRSGPTPTPGGGFDRPSGAGAILLVANCHVEITEATAPAAQSDGDALVIAKWWSVFLPLIINDVALDPATYPKKGDRLTFVDDLGRTILMDIRSVESPETIADHLEILTETFE